MSKKSKVESPLQKQMPDIIGVDISKYQGKVDFNKLKDAGVHYVFIRATEGITYQDADYFQNHNDAKAAGLRVGVYHFYETDLEAKNWLQNRQATLQCITSINPDFTPIKPGFAQHTQLWDYADNLDTMAWLLENRKKEN